MKTSIVFHRVICCLLLGFAASHSLYAQPKKAATASAAKDTASYTYKIVDAANGTFGYDIYKMGRLMVHQPTVPALPGNKGFATKAAAEKVAGLVIQKIKKGEMPPTVSIDEMKKLKAI